ncbi:MAG: hypothetical protein JWP87_5528 [Labilithrix sp.]|nr:hypothetical protein [Labilithrix sp.]
MSYRLDEVTSSASADFTEAYGALDAEFGPRGELERREVVARWIDRGADPEREGERKGNLRRRYHLLVAKDESGALAGVRDCHVVLEPAARIAVVYLAHSLVLPPFRRTGLGARFRSEPIVLATRALADAGMDASSGDLLLAAEMEPAVPEDPASAVRLAAYAKDGFAAIAPAALPYCQPDFRDLDRAADPVPRPIPLLAIVRWVGHEGAASLPKRLARAFVSHLYAAFATHVRAAHLAALSARSMSALDAFESDEVPLLPLPRTTDDHAALAPLMRDAVLPFFSPLEPR